MPLGYLTDDQIDQIVDDATSDDGFVEESRSISTTAPLTGGGDLSANRTFAITAATAVAPGSMSAADKVKLDAITGTNTGDQTSIVGITGTKAQFDTAVTDGNIVYTDAIGVSVQAYDADLTTWAGVTPGTGITTALGINVGSAGAPVILNGALGTPSSGTLTNCTFPTLNQNTTGSAAKLTTARNITASGDISWTVSFDGSGDVTAAAAINAGVILNADINASAAIAFSKMAALTASRALVSDGSGIVVPATTTSTEIGYVNGVTSAIQTQLDAKQPLDSDLTTIAGLTATTDNFIVSVASAWASRTPAQVRTTLGLVIGTNVQAYDADLTTWAGITPGTGVGTALAVNVGSAGAFVTFNGALGTPSSGALTNCTGLPTAGLVDDAVTYAKIQNVSATSRVMGRITAGAGDMEELTAANVKTILALAQADVSGLTTADSPQFTAVNIGHASDATITRTGAGDIAIEGNTIYRAGGTDVPVADGGTGASTAAGARTNLGLDEPTQNALTLNTGWADNGAPYQGATYSKTVDGWVSVCGLITGTAGSTTVFTLPAGYRPANRHIFLVNANGAFGRLDIDSGGNGLLITGSVNSYVVLDGIGFYV